MLRSCRNEVKEEYFAVTAMCINLGDAGEREECFDEAQEARSEDAELCGEQREARNNVCEILMEDRYDPEAFLEPDNFEDNPGVTGATNPYFSLTPGHTHVLRGSGGEENEIVVVTVTDEVLTLFDGVNCRLVVDIVLEVDDEGESEAVEVTDDYYAQNINGDVHYCGEVSRNYEDGLLVDLDGSFMAGVDWAKSGILIKYAPVTSGDGSAHRQEFLLGEAEDVIQYVSVDANQEEEYEDEPIVNATYPCGGECVKTEEFIPPEPSDGEYKYFIAGIGFVLGVALEDGEPTGEREELLCTGPSLKGVFKECEIGKDTRDELCDLSDAFCK